MNTDVSDGEKSKKERKIRAAKRRDTDSDTESDSQVVESVLKPFPKIKTQKAIKITKTISDNECKTVQYVDNHLASSSSFQSDNHILPSDLTTISMSQKRNTEVAITNKKIRKDDINDVEDDDEEDKENLRSCKSVGMCIFYLYIFYNY